MPASLPISGPRRLRGGSPVDPSCPGRPGTCAATPRPGAASVV